MEAFIPGVILVLAFFGLGLILLGLGVALMPWPPKDVVAEHWEKKFWKMIREG